MLRWGTLHEWNIFLSERACSRKLTTMARAGVMSGLSPSVHLLGENVEPHAGTGREKSCRDKLRKGNGKRKHCRPITPSEGHKWHLHWDIASTIASKGCTAHGSRRSLRTPAPISPTSFSQSTYLASLMSPHATLLNVSNSAPCAPFPPYFSAITLTSNRLAYPSTCLSDVPQRYLRLKPSEDRKQAGSTKYPVNKN